MADGIESLFVGLTPGGSASLVTKLVEKVPLPGQIIRAAIDFYAGAKRYGEAAYVAESAGLPDIGAQMRARALAGTESGRSTEEKLTPLQQAMQSIERAEQVGDFVAAQTAAEGLPELRQRAAQFLQINALLRRLWPNQYATEERGSKKQ